MGEHTDKILRLARLFVVGGQSTYELAAGRNCHLRFLPIPGDRPRHLALVFPKTDEGRRLAAAANEFDFPSGPAEGDGVRELGRVLYGGDSSAADVYGGLRRRYLTEAAPPFCDPFEAATGPTPIRILDLAAPLAALLGAAAALGLLLALERAHAPRQSFSVV